MSGAQPEAARICGVILADRVCTLRSLWPSASTIPCPTFCYKRSDDDPFHRIPRISDAVAAKAARRLIPMFRESVSRDTTGRGSACFPARGHAAQVSVPQATSAGKAPRGPLEGATVDRGLSPLQRGW